MHFSIKLIYVLRNTTHAFTYDQAVDYCASLNGNYSKIWYPQYRDEEAFVAQEFYNTVSSLLRLSTLYHYLDAKTRNWMAAVSHGRLIIESRFEFWPNETSTVIRILRLS